jgi:primase-polymerase (primpol)-like protein
MNSAPNAAARPVSALGKFENMPPELRALGQWVLWRREWRRNDSEHLEKPTKVPYAINGRKASTTDPATFVVPHAPLPKTDTT